MFNEELYHSIEDTPFYIYHKGDEVWIGVVTPVGVLAVPIGKSDWMDWLRDELARNQGVQVPQGIKAFIEGMK